MLFQFNESDHSQLMSAVMACIMLAEGEHVTTAGWDVKTGHLDAAEIVVFCDELKKFSKEHPMHHDDTHDLMLRLIAALDSGWYQTVLAVDLGESMVIIGDESPCAYDDVIETRDKVPAAIAKFMAELEAAREKRAGIRTRMGLTTS